MLYTSASSGAILAYSVAPLLLYIFKIVSMKYTKSFPLRGIKRTASSCNMIIARGFTLSFTSADVLHQKFYTALSMEKATGKRAGGHQPFLAAKRSIEGM
jgi:hypothetical protein